MRRDTTETHAARVPTDGRYTSSTPDEDRSDQLGSGAAWTGWLVALLPLGLTVFFASLLGTVAAGSPLVAAVPWAPSLGVDLAFRVDGLGLLFALLISGVGALVLVYAGGYLAGHPQLGRFYAFLLMFMASMLGLVLADNLLLLFVFWELTSLSSYLLIGFDHERAEARAAALQALLVTGGGGLALLAGLLLLGQAGGSLELSALLTRGRRDPRRSRSIRPILLLVLAGAFTKSAQFPFHFWLPAAMEAPTPVSAYLHSATMVKAGVYLLARLSPALGGTPSLGDRGTAVGVVTMLVGAWLALRQSDLKRDPGLLDGQRPRDAGAAAGAGDGCRGHAAMAFLLGHALYKGALFLVAGAWTTRPARATWTGSAGCGRAMPLTAAAGRAGGAVDGRAAAAVRLHRQGAVLRGDAGGAGRRPWVTAAAVAANVLLVAAAGLAGLRPFLGKARATPEAPARGAAELCGWGRSCWPRLGSPSGSGPAWSEPLLGAAAPASSGSLRCRSTWRCGTGSTPRSP